MAFQINVSGIEGELNRRLENLEVLRKEIIPGLAEAMKHTPAYDADVTVTDLGRYFRIGYRRMGTPAKTVVAVRFPEGHGDDYTVYLKAANGVTNARSVVSSRADLIPTIKGILLEDAAEAHNEDSFLTAWQARAVDAEKELKKKVSEEFGRFAELRTEYLPVAGGNDAKSAAVLYWGEVPVVTFEFEGASRYRAVWNALQGETESGRLDMEADDPAAKLVADNWENIKDVLESLYLP